MLEIKNLTKYFDNNLILDNINLTIKEKDIYGILGLSGAGKSTLIRLINGLEKIDSGEILLDNKIIVSSKKNIERENLKDISMIFQNFNLLSQKNVIENINLALKFANKNPKIDKKLIKKTKRKYHTLIKNNKDNKKNLIKKLNLEINKIKYPDAFKMLQKVNLEDKWDSYPENLSGGQKQRVAIARALMNNPKILLCDEATSALDNENTNQILDLLKELNEKLNLTIILISHQMSVIEKICNKVAILDNAKITENGYLSDIFLNPKTPIAKKLIYSSKLNTTLSNNNNLRILFDGNTDEPLIANIIQNCNIIVSIIYADTKVINNKVYGQIVIKMPEKDLEKNILLKYLSLKNINYEEVLTNDII